MAALTIVVLIIGYSVLQSKKPTLQPIKIRREDETPRRR